MRAAILNSSDIAANTFKMKWVKLQRTSFNVSWCIVSVLSSSESLPVLDSSSVEESESEDGGDSVVFTATSGPIRDF
jgi:hypothetical protein